MIKKEVENGIKARFFLVVFSTTKKKAHPCGSTCGANTKKKNNNVKKITTL